MRTNSETSSETYQAGAAALLTALAAILAALAFEHIGGVIPCPLCLQQRYAYYIGIPALFIALVLVGSGHQRQSAPLFFIVSVIFLANAGLGVYHAGAEWGFWPGPDTCADRQGVATSTDELMSQLGETRLVRCDDAAFRLFGLSLAGWNAAVSLVIFALLLRAAFTAHDPILKKSL